MKRKLLKSMVLAVLISAPLAGFSQSLKNSKKAVSETATTSSKHMSFDEYCELNAVQLMDVPSDKASGVKFAGTLTIPNAENQKGLKAFGVKPAENETTYYKLNGSDKILAVKSLYILTLNYANN